MAENRKVRGGGSQQLRGYATYGPTGMRKRKGLAQRPLITETNHDTRFRHAIASEEKAMGLAESGMFPRPGCRHCHCTGVVGSLVAGEDRQMVLCGCLVKGKSDTQKRMVA